MRKQAMEIIYQVRYQQGYLNKALQQVQNMTDEDRRLLTTITYGTIKYYEYLKAILLQQTERLKVKKKIEVLLVMALYQAIFLERIPDYAIINTTVELTKKIDRHVVGFVNACLRQLLTNKEQLNLNVTNLSETEQLALRYSVPEWLIKMFLAQYDHTSVENFLQVSQQPPKQFIRLNRLQVTADYLANNDAFRVDVLPYSAECIKGNAASMEDFVSGKMTIQNLSSQVVGYFVNPLKSDKILDMCAAPGGKTTHLAELTNNEAEIIALDIYEHRVKQITDNAKRLGITCIQALTQDALTYTPVSQFDKILLDAACSGFGTLAQKPEIRYTMTPTGLDALIRLQRDLLLKAWSLLKVGGELVYSTCTINRKENEKQIAWFLAHHENAELLEEKLLFAEMIKGYAGFYMAKMKKVK